MILENKHGNSQRDVSLSVIIPSHNHERFVAQAIRSVLDQTYRDLELIIVDDGSTDDSRQVIRETIGDHEWDRVSLIEQDKAGAHAAIQRGVEVSSGHLLSILNSDDYFLPNRFATLVPMIQQLGCEHSLAFSGLEFVADRPDSERVVETWRKWYRTARQAIWMAPTVSYALMLHNFSVTSGNFVFSRSIYDELGGFCDYKFAHDWDFLLRACYYTEPIFTHEPLLAYRVHDNNTTHSVRDLLYSECSGGMNRYLEMVAAANPPNPMAPCAANWPRYFCLFVSEKYPFYDNERPIFESVRADLRTRIMVTAEQDPATLYG